MSCFENPSPPPKKSGHSYGYRRGVLLLTYQAMDLLAVYFAEILTANPEFFELQNNLRRYVVIREKKL